MNCEEFILDEIEVDASLFKDVLKCILHTILFNRAIGPTKPKEEYLESLDVTFVRCDEPTFEKAINDKVEQFYQTFLKTRSNTKHQVCFLFAEKREKKSWFSKQEELLPWEQWIINIIINPTVIAETERVRRAQLLEKQLQDVMRQVLVNAVETREHVPQFVSSKKGSFAFEISTKASEATGGLDFISRIIKGTYRQPQRNY